MKDEFSRGKLKLTSLSMWSLRQTTNWMPIASNMAFLVYSWWASARHITHLHVRNDNIQLHKLTSITSFLRVFYVPFWNEVMLNESGCSSSCRNRLFTLVISCVILLSPLTFYSEILPLTPLHFILNNQLAKLKSLISILTSWLDFYTCSMEAECRTFSCLFAFWKFN